MEKRRGGGGKGKGGGEEGWILENEGGMMEKEGKRRGLLKRKGREGEGGREGGLSLIHI